MIRFDGSTNRFSATICWFHRVQLPQPGGCDLQRHNQPPSRPAIEASVDDGPGYPAERHTDGLQAVKLRQAQRRDLSRLALRPFDHSGVLVTKLSALERRRFALLTLLAELPTTAVIGIAWLRYSR
jgi:hypothetical protein